MGWRAFRTWLRVRNDQVRERSEGGRTDVDSWDRRDSDPWWDEQHRKARR